jgi:cytochrome P450
VVRVAPNDLSYTDERAWHDIYASTTAARYGMERDSNIADLVGGDMSSPSNDTPRSHQKHLRMRRTFASNLDKRALELQEQLIIGHIDRMVRKVTDSIGQPLDMSDIYGFTSYNLFSDLFLGETLNLFDDPTYIPFVHAFPGFARVTVIVAMLQKYVVVRTILKLPIKMLAKWCRNYFITIVNKQFDRRIQSQDLHHPDLLGSALDEKKSMLSLADLREFAPFLVISGSETTPALLCGLTYLLLKHPRVQEKLTREIREACPTDADITMGRVRNLEYLSACIQEALRLYPPVAAGVGHVVPKGGAQIVGQWAPQDTTVTIVHYAMFRSADNFAKPEEFAPERHLATGLNSFGANDKEGALQPFSIGPQACFGQEYVFRVLSPASYTHKPH